jgi:signal transduction histidine kinase/CheY-like chemotaxis protein
LSHPVQLGSRFIAASKRFSRVVSFLVMLVGLLVLAGWTFDLDHLKGVYGGISMKANTALSLTLAGASLWALNRREPSPLLRLVGQIAAAIVALIGALTLSQHLFGWNLGIDQMLFTEPLGERATASPGRMGPNASTSFTLSGLALLLLHTRRAVSLAQVLSSLVIVLALLAIIGYLYQVEALYGVARYTGIALHTTITFLVLGLGLLAARSDQGIVSVISSDRAGSRMGRRLLIAAVLVPLLMGWLRLLGQRAGYYETDFGTSLLVVVIVVIFTVIIWQSAANLNHIEQQRLTAESAREQLYASEKRARAEAERANRLKDEFLATVSHELRTPLNAILGWGTMIRQGRLDDAMFARAMEAIERNARAQAQLVEDLLDVSRIITGKLRLDVRPIHLISIISAATDSIRPAAQAKGIKLEMVLDPSAGHICGDATRLQQVIWNLLSNAVKFTPTGGVVQVTLNRVDSKAQINVSDTGEGVTPDFLPYIFDRFQQADGSITRSHGGLGLGLAIARYLVEMHGGTIEARSAGQGQGAAFTVKLPLAAVHARQALQTGDSERASLAEEDSSDRNWPNLHGLKILAVDDETDAREMVKGVLEQYGAQVMTAASAREALIALEQLRPDVLVCDIGMPEEDGYSLIREVRMLGDAQGGNTPAVALTGYVRIEERVRALAAGYQMFVPKPVEAGELALIIASLMGRVDKSLGA